VHHSYRRWPTASGGERAALAMRCGAGINCKGVRVSRVRDKAELLRVEINGPTDHRWWQIGSGFRSDSVQGRWGKVKIRPARRVLARGKLPKGMEVDVLSRFARR
jgi:hypothetical protein